MVQSRAQTVDAYLAEQDDARRPPLERMREACRAVLVGWTEGMAYGMPGYGPVMEGAPFTPVVLFNGQKQYLALYAGRTAIDAFADRLGGTDCGKGCIRFRKPDAIDFDLVRDILADIRARGGK